MKRAGFVQIAGSASALVIVLGAAILASAEAGLLWREPGKVASKDLFWGAGSREGAPRPPFEFLEEDKSGTKPKVQVRDAGGIRWNVKFGSVEGDEVPAEVAASRIVWALGYFVEESYYVADGHIDHFPKLRRESPNTKPNGDFHGARFEKRPLSITRSDSTWFFKANRFSGSREFSGLKILMALLSNWDNHDRNNKILDVAVAGGRREQGYVVADWGSSFGRMDRPGFFTSRSRWHLKDYQEQGFIDGVRGRELVLAYRGDEPTIGAVPLEHARWFASLASQLTRVQVRRAFEAAGASLSEADGFSARLIERINELRTLVRVTPRAKAGRLEPAPPQR